MHCSSTAERLPACSHSAQISSPASPIRKAPGSEPANSRNTASGVIAAFAKDIARTDDRVLDIRPGFAFEAQSVFEVERDDRIARELQHEVAQRANGNLLGDHSAVLARRGDVWRVSTSDARCRDQLVDQVIGLHAESLAPAHLDIRSRADPLRRPHSQAQPRSAA